MFDGCFAFGISAVCINAPTLWWKKFSLLPMQSSWSLSVSRDCSWASVFIETSKIAFLSSGAIPGKFASGNWRPWKQCKVESACSNENGISGPIFFLLEQVRNLRDLVRNLTVHEKRRSTKQWNLCMIQQHGARSSVTKKDQAWLCAGGLVLNVRVPNLQPRWAAWMILYHVTSLCKGPDILLLKREKKRIRAQSPCFFCSQCRKRARKNVCMDIQRASGCTPLACMFGNRLVSRVK